MRRFDAAGLIDALNEKRAAEVPAGWLPTKDIVPLLGLRTLSGARLPIEEMLKAGFIEFRRLSPVRFIYRLKPKFKSWADAAAKARELSKPVVPSEWICLSSYARLNKRTVRGIQYRIDTANIPCRVYRTPRPVPHYRKADLDRLLRKAT